ncbi:MAG: hypothetical protein V1916_03250 [Patescibacteria group bacterium]
MIRPPTEQEEHDLVVAASATTYQSYAQQGYLVSTNPGSLLHHDVGNGHFPDVVVWKPSGEYGKTYIIEEVETESTVNDEFKHKEWHRLAQIGGTFYLVVPRHLIPLARSIVEQQKIAVDMVQGYYFDREHRVHFTTGER